MPAMFLRKWRGFAIDDPVEPLRDDWVTMRVEFAEPLAVEDPERDEVSAIAEYMRVLGVRSVPDDVHSFIQQAVQDGTVVWDQTEWQPVRLRDLDRSVRKQIMPIEWTGVWYQSGRILLPASTPDGDEKDDAE
jgi:hypothetical protein